MREYKFRGRRVDNGEWVCGYLVTYFNKPAIQDYSQSNGEIFLVDPETVGQYTSLRDSKRTKEYPNGQEIYEGDILKDDEGIAKVVFEMGQFMAFYKTMSGVWKPYGPLLKYMIDHNGEVIGNVWHPHLLEEAKGK